MAASCRRAITAALAQAIVRLLNDAPLRKRMGDAGFARVNERFTVERMVVETAAAYDAIRARKSEL